MTTVINTRHTTFTIQDPQNDNQCTVNVTAKTLLYAEGGEYNDIAYTYEYSNPDATYLSPFANTHIDVDSSEGDIIKRNPMIDQMIETLFMTELDIGAIIGHADPIQYKVNIMRALSMFWD